MKKKQQLYSFLLNDSGKDRDKKYAVVKLTLTAIRIKNGNIVILKV